MVQFNSPGLVIFIFGIFAKNSLSSDKLDKSETSYFDMIDEIEAEITRLVKTTIESRRKSNEEQYQKIFLRLAATGFTALGRNMLFASTQSVFQGDDDEEEESRSWKGSNGNGSSEQEHMGGDLKALQRSQIVPQILGEPLFYTPASYWLLVQLFPVTTKK